MTVFKAINPRQRLIQLQLCFVFILSCSFFSNASEDLEKMQLQDGFEENVGQFNTENVELNDQLYFQYNQSSFKIWITSTGLTYQFIKIEDDHEKESKQKEEKEEQKECEWARIDMILKGAKIQKENILKLHKSPISYDYYLNKSHLVANKFTRLEIKNIYEGIDWHIFLTENGVKYEFVVHPGANPDLIKIIYEGFGEISTTDNTIEFTTPLGGLTDGELLVKQGNSTIASKYVKNDRTYFSGLGIEAASSDMKVEDGTFSNLVEIELGEYNPEDTLIIDPELFWNTCLGTDLGNWTLTGPLDICVDDLGNMFLVGYTSTANFPVMTGSSYFQSVLASSGGFILKFNDQGVLLNSAYLYDQPYQCDTDGNGNLFVVGSTSNPNVFTVNGGGYYQPTKAGADDFFIMKFDPSGALLHSTYMGGTYDDSEPCLTVDINDNVWLSGRSNPGGALSIPLINGGGYFNTTGNTFCAKLDNNLTIINSTRFSCGGGLSDGVMEMASAPNGDVAIVGTHSANGFPAMGGGYQSTGNNWGTNQGNVVAIGTQDAFIIRFDNAFNITWATAFGGSERDRALSVAFDSYGNIWYAGHFEDANFGWAAGTPYPLTTVDMGGYYSPTPNGETDFVLAKFDPTGTMLWCTYFGGGPNCGYLAEPRGRTMVGASLVVDACDFVYLYATSECNNLPLVPLSSCHYNQSHAGNLDGYLAYFNQATEMIYSTSFGGSGGEFRSVIDIDKDNNLCLSGEYVFYGGSASANSTIPLASGGTNAYTNYDPGDDEVALIAKFIPVPIQLSVDTISESICNACDGAATVNVECGIPPYDYYWSNGVQLLDVTDTFATVSNLCPGNYSVIVKSNCNIIDTAYFEIDGALASQLSISSSNSFCENDGIINLSATLTGGVWSGTGIIDTLAGTFDPSVSIGSNWIYYEVDSLCPISDSILVNVYPVSQSNYTSSICIGEIITINGTAYSANNPSGTEVFLGASANGCDSMVLVNLSVIPLDTNVITQTICPSENLTINGNIYDINNPSGIEIIPNGGVNGCDSVISVALDFYIPDTTNIVTTVCPSENLLVNGNTYDISNPSGIEVIANGNVNGCDSVISIALNFYVADTAYVDTTICEGENIIINGVIYDSNNPNGLEVLNGMGAFGCDSIIMISVNTSSNWIDFSNINIQNESCLNACDGQIQLVIQPGVQLSLNGGPPQQSGTFQQLCPGTYAIVATNDIGCTDSINVSIESGADLDFYIEADQYEGCLPLTVNFEPVNVPAGASYMWDFGNGTSSASSSTQQIEYNSAGCYEVNLTVNYNGCVETDTLVDSICVWDNPIPDFNFSPEFITYLEGDATIDFTNFTINGHEFEWVFETIDGNDTSLVEHPTFDYQIFTRGKYKVCLYATSEYGCTADTCKYIEIKEDYLVYVPNTFTPDGDEFNNVFIPIISPQENVESYELLLFNRWGEIVFESYDQSIGWDGQHGQVQVQDGTYTWQLSLKFNDSVSRTYIGHVSVIR